MPGQPLYRGSIKNVAKNTEMVKQYTYQFITSIIAIG